MPESNPGKAQGRVVGIRILPTPHLGAEMGLTIKALPHTFVLSDKLLGSELIVSDTSLFREATMLGNRSRGEHKGKHNTSAFFPMLYAYNYNIHIIAIYI